MSSSKAITITSFVYLEANMCNYTFQIILQNMKPHRINIYINAKDRVTLLCASECAWIILLIKPPSVLLNNPKGQIAANFLFNIKRNQGLDLMTQEDSQPVYGLDYTLDNYILLGHMMHFKKLN